MLSNVSYGVYKNGFLIRSALCGDMSYEDADALQDQLERDYPGCSVYVSE